MPARISLASNLYFPQSLSYGESYANTGTVCIGIILVRGGDKRLCTFAGLRVASQTSGTRCIILKSSCDGFTLTSEFRRDLRLPVARSFINCLRA
jgi:hypothetical protein